MTEEKEILSELLRSGKVTSGDITEVREKLLTDMKKNTIDDLHRVFCRRNHDNGECDWYKEQLMGEKVGSEWGGRSHRLWVELFNDFVSSANSVKLVPEGVTEESSG